MNIPSVSEIEMVFARDSNDDELRDHRHLIPMMVSKYFQAKSSLFFKTGMQKEQISASVRKKFNSTALIMLL